MNLNEDEKLDAAIQTLLVLKHRLQRLREFNHLRTVHVEMEGREAPLLTSKVSIASGTTKVSGLLWQTINFPLSL